VPADADVSGSTNAKHRVVDTYDTVTVIKIIVKIVDQICHVVKARGSPTVRWVLLAEADSKPKNRLCRDRVRKEEYYEQDAITSILVHAQ